MGVDKGKRALRSSARVSLISSMSWSILSADAASLFAPALVIAGETARAVGATVPNLEKDQGRVGGAWKIVAMMKTDATSHKCNPWRWKIKGQEGRRTWISSNRFLGLHLHLRENAYSLELMESHQQWMKARALHRRLQTSRHQSQRDSTSRRRRRLKLLKSDEGVTAGSEKFEL